jgi:diguanylate cyclase (GGDEF)-like protein
MMSPLTGDAPKSRTRKILVVDDDPIVRDVLNRFLHKMGCLVEGAATGEEAVAKVRATQFDLILLDLVLPEMSGQEVLESIMEIDPGVPVIIVTAYGSTESAVEFLKNGVIDYMTKPIHFEEFKFRINRALEEIRLKQQAITDLKTQLFDHYYFENRLAEELQRAERYGHSISLLMIDLDNFKAFNDTFGHPAGDGVLRQVGTILKMATRECDIPCRYGGEEFSVILPETDSMGAVRVAKKIKDNIEAASFNAELPKGSPKVTASIGVATYVVDTYGNGIHGPNLIVEMADQALYEAKELGKNRVCVAGGLLAEARRN